MYFDFGIRKIVEAAGVIFRAENCTCLSYLRLLKLLYIADRESLRETGRPIIGTRPVAMKCGPLHSKVYDLIKHEKNDLWNEFIKKDGNKIQLKNDPGDLHLSEYEVEKLEETVAKYKDMNEWDLVEFTHRFREWGWNKDRGTSKAPTIPFEDIIKAVDRSQYQEDILLDAARVSKLNRLLETSR